MVATKPLDKQMHPLAEAIYHVIESNDDATLSTAWNAGRPQAARIAAKLEQAGLLANTKATFAARWLPACVIGIVLALGLWKIDVGMDRNKPVGFLVLLSVITTVIFVFFVRKPWRNGQGDRVLRGLKQGNGKIKNAAQLPDSESQLLMQWSLYGLSTMLLTGGAVCDTQLDQAN